MGVFANLSQVALAKEDYEFVHRTADYGLWCLAKESIGPASAFREANKDFVANMEAKFFYRKAQAKTKRGFHQEAVELYEMCAAVPGGGMTGMKREMAEARRLARQDQAKDAQLWRSKLKEE